MTRLAFDARWIQSGGSGISTYAEELLRRLVRIGLPGDLTVVVRSPSDAHRLSDLGIVEAEGNVTFLTAPWGPMSPLSQIRLPSLLREQEIDLLHSPNFAIPLRAFPHGGPRRAVITVHDLIPLIMPDHAPRSLKSRLAPLFRGFLRECVQRARQVVTVSEHSRQDVIQRLGVAPERVTAIPNGVGPQFTPGGTRREGEILFVGRRDPYKNLVMLLDAVAEIRKTVPQARLRVVGPPDDRYPEAPARVRELGMEDAVEWSGHLTSQGLVEAYQRAAVLALPSRYEGFGLPVVEAMACGTPVVCFRGGSLAEVAGGATLHPEPETVEGLAQALVEVLTRPEQAQHLSKAGRVRARDFTWDRAAEATLAVYRRVLKG